MTNTSPIPVWIPDEYSELESAIVRFPSDCAEDPCNAIVEECAGPEIAAQVRKALAATLPMIRDDNDRLIDVLRGYGVQLHFAECQWGLEHNDAFIRDMLFGVRDCMFRGLAPAHRSRNWHAVRHLEPRFSRLHHLQEECDGGDVIVWSPDMVLCGIGNIPSSRGAVALEQCCTPQGVTCLPVAHSTAHADCCIAPLPPKKRHQLPDVLVHTPSLRHPKTVLESMRMHVQEAVLCDDWDDVSSLPTNLLWINPETVLSTTAATRTNRQLEKRGYKVIALGYDKFLPYKGGIRCSVAPLKRRA